jgi:hypothetical protein
MIMKKIVLGAAIACASACIAFASPKPIFGTWGVDLSGMDKRASSRATTSFFMPTALGWLAPKFPPIAQASGHSRICRF